MLARRLFTQTDGYCTFLGQVFKKVAMYNVLCENLLVLLVRLVMSLYLECRKSA
jgi:hypothetical protein